MKLFEPSPEKLWKNRTPEGSCSIGQIECSLWLATEFLNARIPKTLEVRHYLHQVRRGKSKTLNDETKSVVFHFLLFNEDTKRNAVLSRISLTEPSVGQTNVVHEWLVLNKDQEEGKICDVLVHCWNAIIEQVLIAAWIIDTSLWALIIDPDLWEQFGADQECLLFRRADFLAPQQSEIFETLEGYSELQQRLDDIRSFLRLPIEQIPPLKSAYL